MGLNSISTTLNILKKKQVGGVAYKCGKIASVSSDLFFMLGWVLDLGFFFSITAIRIILAFGKQGTGNVDYSKILLAWIVTSFFFGLENDFIYIQNMDQWDTSILDLSFGWTGGSFSPFTDWFQHIWFEEVKGMKKKRRMNRQDR